MANEQEYVPGDVIFVGSAYILTVARGSCFCSNCCEKLPLKFCQKCMFVRYCSKYCQRESWPDHRLECGLLRNLPEKLQDRIRFLGLLILKIKDKNWDDIYEVVDGRRFTFADLITRFEETRNDPRQVLCVKEMKDLLKSYIGDENIPNEDVLWKIIGKMTYNQSIFGEGPTELRILSLGASKLRHSCIPNAELIFREKKIMFQAIAKIRKGEQVTICNSPVIIHPSSSRLSGEMFESFFGPCQCEDCSMPYGASVLSKILDENKAYSVLEKSECILKWADGLLNLGSTLNIKAPVDAILKEQEGVLGNTNILRIRVLALKCLCTSMLPTEQRSELRKLLQYMKEVYGEYHQEVRKVYSYLLLTTGALGCTGEVAEIQAKMIRFENMGFDPIV